MPPRTLPPDPGPRSWRRLCPPARALLARPGRMQSPEPPNPTCSARPAEALPVATDGSPPARQHRVGPWRRRHGRPPGTARRAPGRGEPSASWRAVSLGPRHHDGAAAPRDLLQLPQFRLDRWESRGHAREGFGIDSAACPGAFFNGVEWWFSLGAEGSGCAAAAHDRLPSHNSLQQHLTPPSRSPQAWIATM